MLTDIQPVSRSGGSEAWFSRSGAGASRSSVPQVVNY
jgi:hypothetical protein